MGQSAGGIGRLSASHVEETDEPAVIEAGIEQTRSDLSATVEAIQQRLDPEQAKDSARELAEHVLQEAKEHAREIVQEAGEHAREVVKDATAHVQMAIHDATIGRVQHMVHSAHDRANGASEGLLATIKQNPVPAALAGFGLAWLWMNRRSDGARHAATYREAHSTAGAGYPAPTQAGYRAPETQQGIAGRIGQAMGGAASQVGSTAGDLASTVGGTASNVAGTLGDAAGSAAGAVGETAGHVAGAIGDTASSVAGQVGGAAEHAGVSMQRALQTNPLAVGAVVLALGAAVGLALPQTERENQLLGEARDTLVEKAQGMAQETMGKVQQIATEAQQTVQHEAQKQGLTQETNG